MVQLRHYNNILKLILRKSFLKIGIDRPVYLSKLSKRMKTEELL
jgi:hypothetical protein